MQIHLSRPGGQHEGPFTLEQINQDLASNKYSDSDYWAWYEGLKEWIPLYEVPGIFDVSIEANTHEGHTVVFPRQKQPAGAATKPAQPLTTAAAPSLQPKQAPVPAKPRISAGLPFEALEQIFVVTNGEGEVVARSPVTTGMLHDIIGEDLEKIRLGIPRSVIGRCQVLERLQHEGLIPDSLWRAMAASKPDLVQQARAGGHRLVVRLFPLESGELIGILLFYNKAKMVPPA